MRRIPLPTVITAALIAVVLIVYAVTYEVRFSESVVKVRFGQADASSVIDGRDPNQVGLHFKWPPPIEVVREFDMRQRTLETNETEVKTADGQNLIVGCYAVWKIADPFLYSKVMPSDARAVELLRTRVNEARAIVFGRFSMGDLISPDGQQVETAFNELHEQMRSYAAPAALADYGVELVSVAVRRISLPADATQKVQESMVQERERLATRFSEEGKSIAATIRSEAEAVAEAIRAFARRKAQEIESEGVQSATRLLAEIPEQDQDFFNWLRWLDALEATLRSRSTIFLTSDSEMYPYFNEPRPDGGKVARPGPREGGAREP